MSENVVVDSDWVADNREEVAVVDVRDSWEYSGIGHIPSAVNVPFETFRDPGDTAEGMLPDPGTWTDLLSDAGVSESDTIVAYDDMHGVFAARMLVTAELYGHDDCRLLNGDFSVWQRERQTATGEPDVNPTSYSASEPSDSPIIDRSDVETALDTDAVIVDTRTNDEFTTRHLPGAVNLDWWSLVDEETRTLKPKEDIDRILAEKGITPDRRVILYCNTARRISHTYLVLKHMGFEDIAFYEGSLTEWTERGGPLETDTDS